MITTNKLKQLTIQELIDNYPFVEIYFEDNKLDIDTFKNQTFIDYLNHFTEEDIEEWAIDTSKLEKDLIAYINQMIDMLGIEEEDIVDSLTIIAGTDKSGNAEGFDELTIRKSEIISIVGPTGSGKSRLLADIEWTAQGDTPTSRKIFINGEKPDMKWRFSSSNKLVAQLSQNMNFVMDLSVGEFLELHADSRLVENKESIIQKIIEAANNLAGEKFDLETPITRLSGGQSRALMIADTAILSSSPIVLIDEIENAGIDRKKALELLVGEEKIVIMATHDPSLALMGDRRIVIQNGGIYKVIETTDEEKQILTKLDEMDRYISGLRQDLRYGNSLI
ncbi:ATP-binding cassette domain-containing protein [Vallitalea okinawensis]|uniref:ATP-binding cassette domain-containing protein n=1 Tax=Vallitalea okinawensis TaxID=2078660 RepID=UPI000CFCB640|nr:ATP-binding cassette domain-containing protein [Vallitalea okinawensis]